MSSTLTVLRNRRKRQNNGDARLQRHSKNTLAGCGFLFSLVLIGAIFAFVFGYRYITRDLPPLERIETLLNPRDGSLLQPTRIYDRSGEKLIAVFAPEDAPRRYIPLGAENPQHIPEALANATLALADPHFWEHEGYTLAELSHPEQHPTLSQKLVADLLLWDEPPGLRRAIRERLLAAQLTQKYGKEQILAWYLNAANYGNYAYGADAAAQLYFGKALTELDIAEAATLAATSQSPALNPLDAPTAAYQHRQETLYIMEDLGMLDADQAEAARRAPFNLPAPPQQEVSAPAFVQLTLAELAEIYPRERIERGGLVIISTLDWDLQEDARCTLETQILRLSGGTAENCAAAANLPSLTVENPLENASASALILDPVQGQVLAAVGETSLGGESSRLAAGKSGSSVFPFVYLTGFTRGLSPASLLWDIPAETSFRNFDGRFHGPVRLRIALANDYVIPMDGVLKQMGAENVQRISRSFGLDVNTENPLETPVTILDLARAYGIFAAEGSMYGQKIGDSLRPATVLELRDSEGEIWLDWHEAQEQPVVSVQLAYLMNDILGDDAARRESLGTPNPLEVDFPAAAKIGQNFDARERWTVGYTPQRVAAVWLAADADVDSKAAAGIWHALIKRASEDLPPLGWEMPVGVSEVEVCDPSGLLPTADCPNIVREVFLNGSEPNQYDNLYRSFSVNRETGYLATVFTPPELVEEQVYLIVPDDARFWADSAGIAEPPDAYDAILAPPRLANAYIAAPELFADVRGNVEIFGTASGEDFDYYRLQIGQGLNPQRWIQIGEMHTPIEDGLLGTWDTSELSGLYAIQLLVVHKDKHVDVTTTQVSVDNEPPSLKIVAPTEGEVIDYLRNRQMEFNVQADDNLEVAAVEFYLDFQEIGVLNEAPYLWTWATSTGYHHLKVIVRDRAGNQVEEIVRFRVE